MRALLSFGKRTILMVALAVAAALLAAPMARAAEAPVITAVKVERSRIFVTASVPAGVKKVTLQSRAKVGGGAWEPRAVERVAEEAREVVFNLPVSAQFEMLRVQADTTDPLPASFYTGATSFAGNTNAAPNNPTGVFPGSGGAPGGATDTATGGTRSVVESDIWKLEGDTLYFFNQYRGLQVIDASRPSAPKLRGTYNLAASGEQMYVVQGTYAVLLARSGCYYGADGSQAIIVDTAVAPPKAAAVLPVPGWIQESRMVGSALYVVSQSYRQIQGAADGSMEWGSTVTAFDLADPTAPVQRGSIWYSGYGQTVAATDEYLFLATNQSDPNGWQSAILRCVDISSPNGEMKQAGEVKVAGFIADKFKINQSGETLTAISARWDATRRWVTTLETFSLATPGKPAALGRLELAVGEQLHATRFDGDKVYVVTFFRVDPLWIIDLSNPAKPRVAGELQVPGWSTYIEPLGDRLVTVGIDNTNSWKVAVSLFDVSNPAKPGLLAKEALGDNYSWSEATYDEKAFNVLPEAGLILLPYEGYSTNGTVSKVQLIDLGRDTLALRGTIDHQFQPRRATVHKDSVLSISGRELLSVNATDRDHPAVESETILSWSVNRVFAVGDYLLEINKGLGWYWPPQEAPTIRVAAAEDPDHLFGAVKLANNLPIVGADVRDGKLYVAQSNPNGFGPVVLFNADGAPRQVDAIPPTLKLSVFDLGRLPDLPLLGEATRTIADSGLGAVEPVWPKNDLLVWVGGQNYGFPYALDAVGANVGFSPVYFGYNGTGGRLLAFGVGDPAKPTFQSELNLGGTNGWWNFGAAIGSNGLVYSSHQSSEFIQTGTKVIELPPVLPLDGKTETVAEKTEIPIGYYEQHYNLDVVDYADPAAPLARKPVNIPGLVKGVGREGALIYTSGYHWKTNSWEGTEWIDALAYDGVSVFLVDSLPLPPDWPHPSLQVGETSVFARAATTNTPPVLESWALDGNGKFAKLGESKVSSSIYLLSNINDLLVGQTGDRFELFDCSQPGAPTPAGNAFPRGCFGYEMGGADGTAKQGLWAPMNDYGVARLRPAPRAP